MQNIFTDINLCPQRVGKAPREILGRHGQLWAKPNLSRLFGALLLFALLPACASDESVEPGGELPQVGGNEYRSVIIVLPGKPRTNTYAMAEYDENYIKEIDLLVFAEDGADEKLLYRSTSTNINNVNSDGTQKKVEIKVSNTTPGQKVRFVMFANLRSEISQLNLKAGDKKSDLYNNFSIPIDKWNAQSSSDFKPLPMWGETSGTFEIEESTATFPSIKLLRSLARVDVGLNFSEYFDEPVGLGDAFVLDEVHIFNLSDRAMVVPNSANMQSGKAVGATIPTGTTRTLSYDYDDTEIKEKKSLIRTIYIAEQDAGSVADRANTACVVIGGTIKGKPRSYYRADFLQPQGPVSATDPDAEDIYLPILRNHRYIFNVVQVDNIGYNTVQEALTHNPLNTIQIKTVFYEEFIGSISYDGNYMLAMEYFEFPLDYYSKLCQTRIITDHPDGWTAEVDPDCDWIHIISGDSADCGEYENLVFFVDDNNSNSNRESYILIKFGRLEDKIVISQNEYMPNDGFIYITQEEIFNQEYWSLQETPPQEMLYYIKMSDQISTYLAYSLWNGFRVSVPWGIINGIPQIAPQYQHYDDPISAEDMENIASVFAINAMIEPVIWSNGWQAGEIVDWSDWSLELADQADKSWINVFKADKDNWRQNNYSPYWTVIVKRVEKENGSDIASGSRSARLILKCKSVSRTIVVEQSLAYYVVPGGFTFRDIYNKYHTSTHDLMLTSQNMQQGPIFWQPGYGWSHQNPGYGWFEMANVSDGWYGDPADDQQSPARTQSCAYLNDWNYLGYNDWRLPNIEEAMTIMAYARLSDNNILYHSLTANYSNWWSGGSVNGLVSSDDYEYTNTFYVAATHYEPNITFREKRNDGYLGYVRCVRTMNE